MAAGLFFICECIGDAHVGSFAYLLGLLAMNSAYDGGAHRHIYFCWGGAGRVLSSCRPRFLFLQDGKACQKAFLNLPHLLDRRSFRATGDHIGLKVITFLFLIKIGQLK